MTHFVGGNQIELLRNGAEYFPALESAINGAAREIYLQAYIYQADSAGTRIGDALKHAAKRGVAVKVLLDGFGSKDLPKTFVLELEQAGVLVMFYRPKISPWTLKKRRLRRLHHKIATIDGIIGFVGGINIIDDFDIPNQAPNNVPPRIDYAVRIQGKLLLALVANVQKIWRRIAWIHLRQVDASYVKITKSSTEPANLQSKMNEGVKAALVVRDNVLHRRDIEDAYMSAISQAKREIIIANAYFVPGRRFRLALIAAAKRGVRVRLLLQGRMEYFVMFATHAFYSEFLKNGIEIYEYRKSFMHSKVAVIDSVWATVGSSNIDPFSLLLAREANIVMEDNHFSKELQLDIESSIQEGAHRVDAKSWAQGNIIKRIASWIAYGFVRLLLGVIGQSTEK
ncbi:cardiolipin synthase ClsB [Methylotenera sp.]|uniref:cardiolipin synthase ClsB n=1 Tax=Methylotenera sp. TaxID=2051956 RepID=UPI00271D2D24|nr:cardiolipin synthase ClsB [Methylotenera sp.]MDO9205649.1 cardiolipin synthase ClsB [Methylotenera sp.]MDO9394716.1 cardiolipin synthase ClsB [Methylotenera sp.]MDP1522246.1 cardiolipin synthase ClsB [Methylotenera sp.]MDP2071037.1 cardiolipin synthase ClsB [Methylotenera sp.]MDP3005911.1 cardiolipin synthase ClsB [Methylotenera sp.]